MYTKDEMGKLKIDLLDNIQEWANYKIDALVTSRPKLKLASTYLKRGVRNWVAKETGRINNMMDNILLFVADENGNVIEGWEDPFGVGEWHTFTYNTSANLPTEMYVSDGKDADDWYFWTYTVKVSVDLATMTFKSNGPVHNEAYDCDVTITTSSKVSNKPFERESILYLRSFNQLDIFIN